MRYRLIFAMIFTLAMAVNAASQTTEFTYQGSLKDNANLANANYDFQFRLWGSLSGGIIPLGTVVRPGVLVSNGTFSVQLDFSAVSFNGSPRFLEIGIKPAGSAAAYTILTPRQPISSAPYAVRSLNAANSEQLG